jgi:phenylacetate-CoA ligase
MHLNVETVYTEFVLDGQPAAPEQAAEIIVTPLHLFGMPMLRYRIEDLGSWAEASCPCGRSLPLMHMVQGRVQDLIITRSGRHLTGVFFAHLLKQLDVERFQVVQDSIDALDFSIVPGRSFGARELDYVEKKLTAYTGGELEVRIHLTDHIPQTPSGKHRVTVSRVRGRYSPQPQEAHAR